MKAAMQKDAKTRSLQVRVTNDLWKAVKIKCVEEDTNIQTVVADFLSAWVRGKVEMKD